MKESNITIAYSDQVIEHLHPSDAVEQLKKIYTLLTPKGISLCLTPNRLNRSHDVLKYFDNIATALHLKKYPISEFTDILKKIGFSKIRKIITYKKLAKIGALLRQNTAAIKNTATSYVRIRITYRSANGFNRYSLESV